KQSFACSSVACLPHQHPEDPNSTFFSKRQLLATVSNSLNFRQRNPFHRHAKNSPKPARSNQNQNALYHRLRSPELQPSSVFFPKKHCKFGLGRESPARRGHSQLTRARGPDAKFGCYGTEPRGGPQAGICSLGGSSGRQAFVFLLAQPGEQEQKTTTCMLSTLSNESSSFLVARAGLSLPMLQQQPNP
ncbi:hypothetical protein KC19_8G181400, partial [Ceratodon purpureus]